LRTASIRRGGIRTAALGNRVDIGRPGRPDLGLPGRPGIGWGGNWGGGYWGNRWAWGVGTGLVGAGLVGAAISSSYCDPYSSNYYNNYNCNYPSYGVGYNPYYRGAFYRGYPTY
jgi:hypothetical protein